MLRGDAPICINVSLLLHGRDDVMVEASASQSVDLGFISQKSNQKTLKNGIRSFPVWRSAQKRDSVENKPASLLAMSLGQTLNGMPPSSHGRQMAGPSNLPVVVVPV